MENILKVLHRPHSLIRFPLVGHLDVCVECLFYWGHWLLNIIAGTFDLHRVFNYLIRIYYKYR